MKTLMANNLVILAMAGALALAPMAGAAPDTEFGPHCDTTPTGSLIDQFGYMTICDSPLRPDGSWLRRRSFWGESPRICVRAPIGLRRCIDQPDAPMHIYHINEYDVFPNAIPPGEPGHMG